jgi:hypothetical protein
MTPSKRIHGAFADDGQAIPRIASDCDGQQLCKQIEAFLDGPIVVTLLDPLAVG